MTDQQLTLGFERRNKSPRYSFRHPLIIICEGPSDREFFRKFITARSLTKFDIPFPHDADDTSIEKRHKIEGGRSRFPQMLEASSTSDFAKAVLLVIDSAESLEATLVEAQGYIRRSKTTYEVPLKVMELATGDNGLSIAIATMPPNELGGLETLCYRGLVGTHQDVAECIDSLCQCADIAAWTIENRDKARLQCAIAVLNKSNPSEALRYVLHQDPPFIPLTDKAFDSVEEILRQFAAMAGVQL